MVSGLVDIIRDDLKLSYFSIANMKQRTWLLLIASVAPNCSAMAFLIADSHRAALLYRDSATIDNSERSKEPPQPP